MLNRTLLIGGILALSASLVGPAIQGSNTTGWSFGHQFGAMHGWSAPSGAAIEGARELIVTATDFGFEPATLTAELGESLNLTLVNAGSVPHDFVITELGVHVAADPGEEATVGFSADKAGTFEVLCSYPGHAAAGMTAQLVVRTSG